MRRRFVTTIVGLLVLLCCCANEDVDPVTGSASSSAVLASVPEDWEVTEAELMEAYERDLEQEAKNSRIDDPPDVEFVRFILPEEWARAQVACLDEAGYAAEVNQGGVRMPQVPQEQGQALNRAIYICNARYPLDPRANMPLPRIRAEMQYDYLISEVRHCVEDLGYDVDDPPSMETWLGAYYADEPTWDPFAAVVQQAGEADVAALDQAYDECPRWAPDLFP